MTGGTDMNKKFKVGLIRVLTTEDEEVLQSHGKQIMEYFPELEVVTKCIPDQYEGIHSPELGEIAIPKIVETARSFTDVDMIIVSCADDPGVAEIRKVLPDIPVTGGGETTVALALKYGSRIGVLGITDYAPQAYMRMIPEQMILGRPEGVHSTLDLMTPEGKASVLKLGMKLKEQGAEDKFYDVLEEVPRVRKDLGECPLVTPSSQIVGTQAVFNVLMGERYKMVTKETKDILLGKYGATVKPFNPEVQKKCIGDEKPITCRPADLLDNELEKLESEMAQYKEQDEDVLTYALFPQVAMDFFKYRQAQKTKVDEKAADKKNGAYPV